jgi:hypothetical protein
VFAGQTVGTREVSDRIWLVRFLEFDLGFFDLDEDRVEPAQNPFLAKVLPMSPAPCVRIVVASTRIRHDPTVLGGLQAKDD